MKDSRSRKLSTEIPKYIEEIYKTKEERQH